jgi:hypothetical protein
MGSSRTSSGRDLLLDALRWLKHRLPLETRDRLRRQAEEPLARLFSSDLPRLARIYRTDKWGSHWYAAHYAHHLRHLRNRPIVLLEIGIGGEGDPGKGGESLRMWRRYFPRATVVGLDIHDKRQFAEDRIRIYQGDQSDEAVLRRIVAEVGRPDVVIDDGSHVNAHVLKSFEVLFPLLQDDGIYAIEDLQTSYWPRFGGSSEDLTGAPTSMCLLKRLLDGLNHEEFLRPGYVPSHLDEHVTAVHAYHNLAFVQKGRNKEGSYVKDNAL